MTIHKTIHKTKGKKVKAIIGFPFGGSLEYGPGAANEALGKIIDEVAWQWVEDLVVIQSPLDQCILTLEDLTISSRGYIDTEEVIGWANSFLQEKGVTEVRLVAHPFHRFYCARLLRRKGFDVEIVPTGWVPFDRNSDGWWTRGPLRLMAYSVLATIGLHGIGYRKPKR
ncbi:MAG: hypothetical protein AB1352_04785 [Patescibacteria group bacterium]